MTLPIFRRSLCPWRPSPWAVSAVFLLIVPWGPESTPRGDNLCYAEDIWLPLQALSTHCIQFCGYVCLKIGSLDCPNTTLPLQLQASWWWAGRWVEKWTDGRAD